MMNTPETINIEKYAEALNNLVGIDIGYLGDSDENVNAIVEVIVAAKKFEGIIQKQKTEISKLKKSNRNWRRKVQRLRMQVDELEMNIENMNDY